jgi:hypothetical protein
MRNYAFHCVSICLLLAAISGCGGSAATPPNPTPTPTPTPSASPSPSPTPTPNAQVAGTWKILLSENQSAAFQSINPDTNTTRIEIRLLQSDTILQADNTQLVWYGNVGCGTPGVSFWAFWGGWENRFLSLASGQVSGNSVSLVIDENEGANQPSGQLKLLGTVQADGSISGTVTDTCINATGVTFTATQTTAFPPSAWPN